MKRKLQSRGHQDTGIQRFGFKSAISFTVKKLYVINKFFWHSIYLFLSVFSSYGKAARSYFL